MRCPHALAILAFLAHACVGQPFTCADADPLACASLGDLYYATGGPSWVFQTGWSNASAWTAAEPAPSYCDFYGVSCTADRAVTQLLLPSNHLTGSLPSLGNLNSLVFLFLNENTITGTLPSSWGSLTNLQSLSLTNNPVTGTIPDSWCSLTSLKFLVMGYGCQLTGTLPANLGSMTSLTQLDFFGNRLSGSLPASMAALGALTMLNLEECALDGSLPDWIPSLTSLNYLNMYSTGLSGTLPCLLAEMTLLTSIDFGLNAGLVGELPDCLAALTHLKELRGLSAGLTGTLPAWPGSVTALTSIALSSTHFSGTVPASWASLTNLESIYMGDTYVSGGLDWIDAGFQNLTRIDASVNLFLGTLPAAWGNLTRLAYIDLSSSELSGTLPDSWAALSSLTSLLLLNSGLCGTVPFPLHQTDGSLPSCLTPLPADSRKRTVLLVLLFAAGIACLLVLLLILHLRRKQSAKALLEGAPAHEALQALLGGDDLGVDAEEGEAAGGALAVEASAADVRLLERLGEGGFATVWAASWNGTRVAAKVLKPRGVLLLRHAGSLAGWHSAAASAPAVGAEEAGGSNTPFQSVVVGSLATSDAILHEVSILAQLRHPNIVAIYGAVRSPPMLLMEIASQGSLAALLRRSSLVALPWLPRVRILVGVACGVEYLHRQEPAIIHLDLKSANVLLGEGLVPRVSDFGLSMLPSGAGRSLKVGTPCYMSPEMATGQAISDWKAVDSYGFGQIALDCSEDRSGGAGEETAALSDLTLRLSALMRGASLDVALREEESFAVRVGEAVQPRLARLIYSCLEVIPGTRPPLTAVRTEMEGIAEELGGEADQRDCPEVALHKPSVMAPADTAPPY